MIDKYAVIIWLVGQVITVLSIPFFATLMLQSGMQPGDLRSLWVAVPPIAWFLGWMGYFWRNWKQ